MPAIVDATAEHLLCGGRVWPFKLDCREDTATVELDGIVYRLRPLRWREKRNLARYALVGAGFIEKHFVSLSLMKPAELPQDSECREALAALARWINTPGEENGGLPLESELLTRVSLELCRVIGCRPGDLDWQPARDIERLWAARRPVDATQNSDEMEETEAATHALPLEALEPMPRQVGHPGDMNRIEIVPDRAGESTPPPAIQPVSLETGPAANAKPASAHTAIKSAATPAATSSRDNRRPLERFRVALPTSPNEASLPTDRAGPQRKAPSKNEWPSVPVQPAPPNSDQLPGESGQPPQRFHFMRPASIGETSPRPSLPALQPEMPPMRGWPRVAFNSAQPATRQVLPRQWPDNSHPSEALFDELTERLEQAVEELGIDLEQ